MSRLPALRFRAKGLGAVPMVELRNRAGETGQPWCWHSRGEQTSWCYAAQVRCRALVPEQAGMAIDR